MTIKGSLQGSITIVKAF